MKQQLKDKGKKLLHYLKDPRNIVYYLLAWLIIYSPFILLLTLNISTSFAWVYFAFIVNPITPFWALAIILAIALRKILDRQ